MFWLTSQATARSFHACGSTTWLLNGIYWSLAEVIPGRDMTILTKMGTRSVAAAQPESAAFQDGETERRKYEEVGQSHRCPR
ncbi:hypothetical protein NEUTE2DRAFT_145170 [Neurospora tetrasperma FGSC 2509]|nr:hypothetical protein NEUTE2DRAFT_145170 [Neurospora tetrasperma FGSC 2509]